MRTAITVLIVVALLSSIALAGLSGAVGSARGAIDGRLGVLVNIEEPTKVEKKEARKLTRALKKLAAYLGLDDPKDLRRCYAGAKLILKSKTTDPALWSALEEIKDALEDIADDYRGQAVELLPTVRANKQRGIERLIERGDMALLAADEQWPDDPKKCIRLLLKAIGAFRRAALRAEKFQEEPEPTPAKVYVYNTSLFNNTDEAIQITDITYAVNGTLGGAPYSFGGKASQTHPQLLPITIPSMGSYNFLPITTALCTSDPNRPALIPGDIVAPSYTLHTTAGDFSSP